MEGACDLADLGWLMRKAIGWAWVPASMLQGTGLTTCGPGRAGAGEGQDYPGRPLPRALTCRQRRHPRLASSPAPPRPAPPYAAPLQADCGGEPDRGGGLSRAGAAAGDGAGLVQAARAVPALRRADCDAPAAGLPQRCGEAQLGGLWVSAGAGSRRRHRPPTTACGGLQAPTPGWRAPLHNALHPPPHHTVPRLTLS